MTTSSKGAFSALHNVYFVQYIYLTTKQFDWANLAFYPEFCYEDLWHALTHIGVDGAPDFENAPMPVSMLPLHMFACVLAAKAFVKTA